MSNGSKVILITGASSGIGRATATLLAERGYRVFGTSRSGQPIPGTSYTMLPLELSSAESVQHAVAEVQRQAGRLDVLINNAGFGVVGAIEETDIEQALEQYEVFLFGVMRTAQAALPLMRAQQSGTIINVSSSATIMALPFTGIYSSSKAAMARLSEAMRYELAPLGIRVAYIEATAIRTHAAETVRVGKHRIAAYSPARDRAVADFQRAIRHGADPQIVATAICKAIEDRRPRLVYRATPGAWWIPRVRSLVPQRIFDWMFGLYVRMRGGVMRGA